MTAILLYTCYVTAAAASIVPYHFTRIYQITVVSHSTTSSQLIDPSIHLQSFIFLFFVDSRQVLCVPIICRSSEKFKNILLE